MAKVKCSGDRAGCERCRSTGFECVYMESRVGRVQGPRTRGRPPLNGEQHHHRRQSHQQQYDEISQPQQQQQQQQRQTAPGRTSFSAEGSLAPGSTPPPSSSSNNDVADELLHDEDDVDDGAEDDIMAWAAHPWHLGPSCNSPSTAPAAAVDSEKAHDPSSIHVAHPSLAGGRVAASGSTNSTMESVSGCEDFDLGELGTDLAEFLRTQSPEAPTAATSIGLSEPGGDHANAAFAETQQVMPMSLGLRPRNEADSQCCIACCQAIEDLENYIMAELRTFKILISIIRKALEKLSHLIGAQQGSRNLRCMMLFTALMYQIYELLEACFRTVVQEKNRQLGQRGGLPGAMPSSFGFGFGEFSAIDAEEQAVLRTQSVLREVQQASEVLGKLKALAAVGPEADGAQGAAGPDPTRAGEARGNCYLDLEMRLRDLAMRFSIARDR